MVDHGHGSFADAAKAAERRKVVMVVAGTEMLLEEAVVPTTNLSKALKAVPFALEEQLAQDIEASHFAFGNRLKNNAVPVAVIARNSMEWILAQCRQAKLNPQEIVPEVLALPLHEGHATIMTNSGHAAVRLSQSKGFSCDADMLSLLLANEVDEPADASGSAQAGGADAGNPIAERSEVINSRPEDSGNQIIHHALHFVCGRDETVLETRERPIEIRTEVDLFARGLAQYGSRKSSALINLLQSGYDKKENVGKAWKPWRVPAALAATLVALWGGSSYLQFHELGLEQQRLRGEIVGTLKSTFPDIRKPENDPIRQMRSRIKAGSEGGIDHGGFVAMMSAIGAALAEVEKPAVKSMNYRKGKLDIEFEAASLPDVDKIKSRLEVEKKLSANVLSANKERDRIKARMRVESRS